MAPSLSRVPTSRRMARQLPNRPLSLVETSAIFTVELKRHMPPTAARDGTRCS